MSSHERMLDLSYTPGEVYGVYGVRKDSIGNGMYTEDPKTDLNGVLSDRQRLVLSAVRASNEWHIAQREEKD